MSQPYTVKFGPWLPDLDNVSVQTQYQMAEATIPCSDCLNVYYSDGAYRSLSTPVALSSPSNGTAKIPFQPQGVFTASDPADIPNVYAGTATGAYRFFSTGNNAGNWVSFLPTSAGVQWSFCQFDAYVYATDASLRCVDPMYSWQAGTEGGTIGTPSGSPFCNVVATVGQFVMAGDIGVPFTQSLTPDGSTAIFQGTLTETPIRQFAVQVFLNGVLQATDNGSFGWTLAPGSSMQPGQGTIIYDTGQYNIPFNFPLPITDTLAVQYVQVFPQRLQWCAIGNPQSWPVPFTDEAVANQAGEDDLESELGPVMGIAGYPLYGVVFQRSGITRASYIGGDVVFSWGTYERKHGLVARKAFCQAGSYTYFLSDEGFFVTDGANVIPIGTAQDNSSGIDRWFWTNVNKNALSAIESAYDAHTRCVHFSIPTGTNTIPDTMLIFNPLSSMWTRAAIAASAIWTDSDGTRHRLGIIGPSPYPYQLLTGAPIAGYCESSDITFTDGAMRFCSGIRPNIDCSDVPTALLGSRNTLSSTVIYSNPTVPHPVSKVAPQMVSGRYLRMRLSSTNAQSLRGGTMMLETLGPV